MEELVYYDLVKRDGIYYEKFTTVPFTGKVTGEIQGSFKDGKEIGLWVCYWKNGQLYSKGTYKDGEKDGPWVEYHENGRIYFQGEYKNGLENGSWTYYHKSGKVDHQGTFRNGEKHGRWVGYYDDGTPNGLLTGTYRNGVDDRFRRLKDHQPWDGPRVEYHENGLLKCEGIFKDGFWDGPLVSYYDNGNLDSKGTFKDGKEDGPWVAFNKDGTVYPNLTGTFKYGVKVK